MWNWTRHTRRPILAALLAAGVFLAAGSAHAANLNCVQFVQRSSSVELHGDAWQWWEAAEGQYGRGRHPRPGAVMVFSKTGHLHYGHVAVVRAQRNSRTILVDHANWSPLHGRRGQIEKAVVVVDVSPGNDWSQVRVWYQPAADIGNTVYPIRGFVYPAGVQHHTR